MGLAGKLNWLLAGDSVAEVAEVWIQKCSMRGYSHGEGEVLSHSCCIHGAMCMVILCYLQIHQRIHQKHPETGKSTGVVIFTWGEAHTASTQIGDLLPWGPGDRASHQNVGHWFPRRSTTNKTWAAIHHWQGIWVSWCWEFPLQFTLESVRCRIFRILHQSMHPTATPWRLHGSVSRRSCVQIHAVRLFLKIVVGSIRFKTWSDGLGLKIINHDTHDGRCLGKSWKNKLGQWNLSPHLPGSAVGSVLQVPGGQCDFGVALGKRSEILVANFLHLSATIKVKPRMMRDHFSIYVNFMQVRSVLFLKYWRDFIHGELRFGGSNVLLSPGINEDFFI